MKKIIAMLLAVLLVAALTACGTTPPDSTKPADQEQAKPTQPQQTEPDTDEGVFSFTFEGVELIPGAPFEPTELPEAENIYEVPSCAIEGTDSVYSYTTIEVTAYDDGSDEVIYSIYLVDANTPTTEGLYVGDDLARVEALYGTGYETNDTELTFTKGNTTLNLLMEGDYVISIEYRMAV